MLKPSEQPGAVPTPPEERPVGEIVHELVENGKAYAKAELDLAKAIAIAKANAFKIPAILLFAALLIVQGGVTVLGVGVLLGLAPGIGPVVGGLIVFLLMGVIAGGLAWYAVKKIREDL